MSYIGSTPTTQSFISGTDSFNGTGSATNFTLTRSVNSTNDIQVVVNNVVQYPPNYSVSGTTLTISPAPSSGTNNVYVRYLSTTLQSITIPGGSSVVGNFGLSGNLQFLGSTQRITGDFSNATVANRVIFQTSTTNGNTVLNLIPNGTGTVCAFGMDSDPALTNSSTGALNLVAGTDVRLAAGIRGTSSYLPMTFYTGGSKQAEITTAGLFQFNSGYGSVATAFGCRAWVNFNGTGTVAIRASGNVSSITDNGVGNYTINFTTALVDGNYSIAQTLSAQAANNDGGVAVIASGTTPSTTSFNMVTDQRATGEYDPTIVCFSVFR